MEEVKRYIELLEYDFYDRIIEFYYHYFESIWKDLFNYFFYCKKNKIENDLSFLHSGFIKHKHWLKHIKLSLFKKIGILLFFWKQWLLLKIYYYFVYIFYTCGIKKLKDKFQVLRSFDKDKLI